MRLSLRRMHGWLGWGLGWLMLIWFISGGVMMYAHLPHALRSPQGRLDGVTALDPQGLALDFVQAWERAGRPAPLTEARLHLVAGRPAYLFARGREAPRLVWADSGQRLLRADAALARRAAAWQLGSQAKLTYQGLIQRDQWTLGSGAPARLAPFHVWEAADGQGTRVHVSARTGEVCQLTTRASRFWSWLGTIPHWFYFTILRSHHDLWYWGLITLSGLGCLLCLSGLWLGVRYFRLSGWGQGRYQRRSAFWGPRKWHHYLGLIFGLPALAWTFSGLLSLHPFDWHAPDHPRGQPAVALAGGALEPAKCRLHPRAALAALPAGFAPRLLRLINFQGQPYYLALDNAKGSRLIGAGRDSAQVEAALPMVRLKGASGGLLPGCRVTQTLELEGGDLYLPRWKGPLLKLVYDDPHETWLYLDPRRARIIRSLDSSGRINRWLYGFLHRLDLPWLLDHDLARQVLMLVLLAGGALLCLSGPWSWLARRSRRAPRRAMNPPGPGSALAASSSGTESAIAHDPQTYPGGFK